MFAVPTEVWGLESGEIAEGLCNAGAGNWREERGVGDAVGGLVLHGSSGRPS